jgi:hypothetical protein
MILHRGCSQGEWGYCEDVQVGLRVEGDDE